MPIGDIYYDQKDFLGMPIGDITSGGLYLESKWVIPQIILG